MRRVNRFRVTVAIGGVEVDAHLPNSGRLTELLTLGRECWLEPAGNPRRKTAFDLKLVAYVGTLVSVDARLPNPLLAEALEDQRLAPFRHARGFDREVFLGDSRIDFQLRMPGGILWIETKSVTLVEDGVALFPDAPTARGSRHLRSLAEAARGEDQAAVVFVVQRSDAQLFAPHASADPLFARTLRQAADGGVGVYAWSCRVSRGAIEMDRRISIDLV